MQKGRGTQIYDTTALEDRPTHLLLISIPHLCSVLRLPWMWGGWDQKAKQRTFVCMNVCGGHFSLKDFFFRSIVSLSWNTFYDHWPTSFGLQIFGFAVDYPFVFFLLTSLNQVEAVSEQANKSRNHRERMCIKVWLVLARSMVASMRSSDPPPHRLMVEFGFLLHWDSLRSGPCGRSYWLLSDGLPDWQHWSTWLLLSMGIK